MQICCISASMFRRSLHVVRGELRSSRCIRRGQRVSPKQRNFIAQSCTAFTGCALRVCSTYRVAGQNPDFFSPPEKRCILVTIHPKYGMFQIAPFPGYTMGLEWLLYSGVSWRYLIFQKCVEKKSVTFLHRGFRGIRDELES